MLYAGLDLSRKRLDFHLLDRDGATVEVGAAPPDADGLLGLTRRLDRHREPIRAAIESMNGARFVHDRLELAGWQVEIADAQKVKGLAPLACKTDRIDAWVLAELTRRDLVPAIWLPDPMVRAERERARWRLHLVRHRSSLKQRVHAVLLTHGKPCPVSDLFGVRGRQLLARLGLPEPWQATIEASMRLIDELEREISDCERELRRLGADHRYVPLLLTVPGIGWVLAYDRGTLGLARSDAPVSAVDPVDDDAAVFVRCLLPREVTGGEWMDLAVGQEFVEVLVVGPRHEVVVASGHDLGRRRDRRQQVAQDRVLFR